MPNLTLDEQFAHLATLQPIGDDETDWLYPINPLSIEQGKAFVETMQQLVKEAGLQWYEPRVSAGQDKETEIEWSWHHSPGTKDYKGGWLVFSFYGDNTDTDDDPETGFIMGTGVMQVYFDYEPTTLLGAYQTYLEKRNER